MALRTYLLAASLLGAIPSTLAISAPAAISVMTGPAVAAATNVQASTVMMSVGVANGNLTAATAAAPAPPAATAASSTNGTTGATGATGAQNVWVIKVGSANGSLTFSPDAMNAAVGDMIQFQFYPRNHSVVLGDYANACQPAAATTPNDFFSGFMPTASNGQLTFTMPVRDTAPMWMYCSQAKHCQEGMVAVINPPPSGQTLTDYKARAAMAANNVTPQVAPSAGAAGTAASALGATPSGPSSTPAATATKNSATAFRFSSWSLAIVAAVVIMLL